MPLGVGPSVRELLSTYFARQGRKIERKREEEEEEELQLSNHSDPPILLSIICPDVCQKERGGEVGAPPNRWVTIDIGTIWSETDVMQRRPTN